MLRAISPRRAGFSLTEVVLSLFLLTSMMLVAGLAVDRTLSMFRQRRAEQDVCAQASRLLQRMASELVFAGRDGIDPPVTTPDESESLSYRVCTGAPEGAQTWGIRRRIALEYEPGEDDDGLDNDGDGLVDEGVVVWIEDEGQPGERRVTWTRGVREFLAGEDENGADDNGNGLIDERGLSFTLAGDVLTLRITVQGVGPGGTVVTKSLETSVFVRN